MKLTKEITFSKYSGAGNDFILIDDRNEEFPVQDKPLIQRFCHRQNGIGADGIILLQNSVICDLRMRIINADGSEAEMCGNGVRCFAKFAHSLGIIDAHFTLQTMERRLNVTIIEDEVSVEMGEPKDWRINIEDNLHHVDTGVPHAIRFVDEIHQIDVQQLGKALRFDKRFAPRGANANFIQIKNNEIFIRTYERGVESETLACGTGATAAALIAAKVKNLKSPITVYTKSLDKLTISFNKSFEKVCMQGPAHFIFQGIITL